MSNIDLFREFRDDHRKIRDLLLDLGAALEGCDVPKAREILGGLDTIAGPHFRFEEEALYPALRGFLGEYVDKLVNDHGGAINTARGAADLLKKDSISREEGVAAAKAARSLLIHVSDCDGLAVIAERLTDDEIARIGQNLGESRSAGVPLLEWAEKIRNR